VAQVALGVMLRKLIDRKDKFLLGTLIAVTRLTSKRKDRQGAINLDRVG